MSTEETLNPSKQERLSNQSVWSIGLGQILSTVPGTILLMGINFYLEHSTIPNAASGLITLNPGIILPLFCGITSGPIAGLLVGGAGNALSDLISYHTFYWNWDLGYALIGFLAGFSFLFTVRFSKRAFTILIAEIVCLSAITIGIGFAALSDILVIQINISAAASEFLYAFVTDTINGLILLPIVLLIYTMAKTLKRSWSKVRFSEQ
jgi:energy-coupling factor transport system substrate-specific component